MAKEKVYLFDHSPHLRDEWDFTKNSGINPYELTIGSNKKVWWTCSDNHSIQRDVYSTVLGRRCLYCIGQLAIPGETDLLTIYPECRGLLVDPEVGSTVLTKSNQRLEWVCSLGHKYIRRIADAVKAEFTCPYCVGRTVLVGYNDLESTHPEISSELRDPSLGREITYGSGRKVEWVCAKGHTYSQIVKNRTKAGQGCPYCSGRSVLVGFNDLATTHPELAGQFSDPRDAYRVSKGSMKKIDWVCSFGHRWTVSPCSRIVADSHISGCPVCFTRTSKAESVLREMLSNTFDLESTDHTYRLPVPFKRWKSMQVDIHFIFGSLSVVVEYDGCYWHKDSIENDILKTSSLLDEGYTVIRLREQATHMSLPMLDLQHTSLLQLEIAYSTGNENIEDAVTRISHWITEKIRND